MLETPNCVTLQETNILNISLAGVKENHLQKILGRGYVTSHAGIQGSYSTWNQPKRCTIFQGDHSKLPINDRPWYIIYIYMTYMYIHIIYIYIYVICIYICIIRIWRPFIGVISRVIIPVNPIYKAIYTTPMPREIGKPSGKCRPASPGAISTSSNEKRDPGCLGVYVGDAPKTMPKTYGGDWHDWFLLEPNPEYIYPKDPWTLQWRGERTQNSHFWGVRILRVRQREQIFSLAFLEWCQVSIQSRDVGHDCKGRKTPFRSSGQNRLLQSKTPNHETTMRTSLSLSVNLPLLAAWRFYAFLHGGLCIPFSSPTKKTSKRQSPFSPPLFVAGFFGWFKSFYKWHTVFCSLVWRLVCCSPAETRGAPWDFHLVVESCQWLKVAPNVHWSSKNSSNHPQNAHNQYGG